MFFIKTIGDFLRNRRETRKAQRLSIESMGRYFSVGEKLYDALRAAEDIIGSHELGLTEENINLSDDSATMSVKYDVDARLTVYIYRMHAPLIKREFKRKTHLAYTLKFTIDGVNVKYSPDTYKKLVELAITSIYKRVKDYNDRADAVLSDYFATHSSSSSDASDVEELTEKTTK